MGFMRTSPLTFMTLPMVSPEQIVMVNNMNIIDIFFMNGIVIRWTLFMIENFDYCSRIYQKKTTPQVR